MKATLFIPHIIYDDEKSFQRFVPKEEQKDYNINLKLRIDTLNESANEVSEEIDKLIWNYSGNDIHTPAINDYLKADKQFINSLKENKTNFVDCHNIKLQYDKNEELEKKVYSPIPIIMYNTKGQDLILGNLLEYYKMNCDFPCIVEIDLDNSEGDGESVWNTWVSLTRKLYSLPPNRLSQQQKFIKAPVKTFAFEIINDYGTLTKGYFKDCKLIEKVSINKYALYIKNITFVNNNTKWNNN